MEHDGGNGKDGPDRATEPGPPREHGERGERDEPGAEQGRLQRAPVVAYVKTDDLDADVRQAAFEHATGHGCPVILFVADAASIWSEPLPNQWASEGEKDQFGSRLGLEDLEMLGRSDIRRQVAEGRRAGVETFAWLPKDHGPGALAEYAREQGAHMILVPDALEGIDELSSLVGGSTAGKELAEPGIELRRVGSTTEMADIAEGRQA
jgi:hypothetical protein